jgi:cytochrome b subunit of formate dehydrogenase
MTTLSEKTAGDAPVTQSTHKNPAKFLRFDQWQRIEHILLLTSFTVLVVTGLPQKYSTQLWANWMIEAMGGIETVRIVHRIAAIILMAETIYHFGAVAYRVYVKRVRLTMLPSMQDVKDGIQALGHNVGVVKTPPYMGRYNFGEKVEYWAVIWGTVIMVITGFMLWNPIATTSFLPGQFIPAAKAAHGGEALLAFLSILTWHLYNVHIKRFNKSMFTGYISRHEMEEEHPEELEQIETGQTGRRQEPEAVRRRRRIFLPVAAIVTVVMLASLYLFITYEQTAISTVPRQEIEVFVPQTPEALPAP